MKDVTPDAVLPPVNKGGRPKGGRNAVGASLKDSILQALENVGGPAYLTELAIQDPRTFCGLLSRVLPMSLSNAEDADLKISVVEHKIIRGPE